MHTSASLLMPPLLMSLDIVCILNHVAHREDKWISNMDVVALNVAELLFLRSCGSAGMRGTGEMGIRSKIYVQSSTCSSRIQVVSNNDDRSEAKRSPWTSCFGRCTRSWVLI
jgi:hypothetical protein